MTHISSEDLLLCRIFLIMAIGGSCSRLGVSLSLSLIVMLILSLPLSLPLSKASVP